MTERQIHDGFIAWLKKHEVPFIHHRMDRRSGIKTGWPDFTVLWMSRVVCIEVKTAKGRISLDQARVMAFIRRSGNKVEVRRSVEECIESVKNILCEGKLGEFEIDMDGASRPDFKEEFAAMKAEVAKVPGNVTKPLQKDRNGAGLEPFYVANWDGTNIVIAREQNGSYRQIRLATPADVINLPKLP